MSIKAGAILFDANGYVIDRIQSGGPGALNIPEEKIYEVGNWQSVGTVYDIPDLSFDLESFDVSPEFEFILINEDPVAPSVSVIDFQDAFAIDVISPFKSARNAYNIINGVVVPYLTLERVNYSFGVGSSATQSFTLRGDSIFYVPGVPYIQRETLDGMGGTVAVTYDNPDAAVYNGSGSSEYALNICLYNSTSQLRLFEDDMTSASATGFTIPATYNDGTWDYVQICYSGEDGATPLYYTQDVHAEAGQYTIAGESGPMGLGASPGASPFDAGTKPAAIRAKDIDIYTADATDNPDNPASATWTRLTGVQNFDATWQVTLENDEELGNDRYVDQDYDTPEVNGSMTIKAYDVADLFSKINLVTGVTAGEVLGPNITDPIQLQIGINDPLNSGARIKTIHLPEARFTVPGMNAQVQTKLESQFDFTSDTGVMKVYKGAFS